MSTLQINSGDFDDHIGDDIEWEWFDDVKTFDLRNCRLTSIPEGMASLSRKKKRILLDGNPLSGLSLALFRQRCNFVEMMEAFDECRTKEEKCNEVKLMVVGEAGAGKVYIFFSLFMFFFFFSYSCFVFFFIRLRWSGG